MKGLLYKDLLVMNRQRNILLVLIGFYFIYSYMLKDTSMLMAISAMFSFLMVINSFAYDDKAKWDNFILTTTVSRSQLVLSKYILAIGGGIIVTLLTTVIAIAVSLTYTQPVLSDYLISFVFVVACIISLFAAIIPVIYKFGVEKSRIIMMAIVLIPILIGYIGTQFNISLPTIPLPVLAIAGVVLLIIAVFVSYRISVGIMLKKEL